VWNSLCTYSGIKLTRNLKGERAQMKKAHYPNRLTNVLFILVLTIFFALPVMTGCGGAGTDITAPPASNDLIADNPSSDSGVSDNGTGNDTGISELSSDGGDEGDGPDLGEVPGEYDTSTYEGEDLQSSDDEDKDTEQPQDSTPDIQADLPGLTGGHYLDPAEFDLLLTLSNPISDDMWNMLFASKGGDSADRNAQGGTEEPSFYHYVGECCYEITVAFTTRRDNNTPNEDFDNGTYKYKREVLGSAHVLYVAAPKASVGVSCWSGPWDKTEMGYGLDMVEYKVTYRLVSGNAEDCPYEPDVLAEAEAIYKSEMWARTWVGMWSPFCTRISNAYAVDRAQAIFNGKVLFDEAGGAQSGDQVSSTIDISMGGEFSGKDGLSGNVTISSSETHVKDSGTAEDFINGFGKDSSNALAGWLVINSGGKAFARHDGRAGARSRVLTNNTELHLVVTVEGVPFAYFYQAGADSEQMAADKTNMAQPFYKARGFDNFPN